MDNMSSADSQIELMNYRFQSSQVHYIEKIKSLYVISMTCVFQALDRHALTHSKGKENKERGTR